MSNIQFPHDRLVRKILSDRDLAVDYFRSALPAHVVDRLDFSTMRRLNGTYVSEKLEETVSDVVYSCARKDRSGVVEISFLVEHKSSVDQYTPVQIGGYLFSGYRQQLKEKRDLSPIIPILFYHGEQAWEYRTLDKLFTGLDDDLLDYIPKYDYIYHNLRDLSEEAIRLLDNQFLVSFLLTLKYAFDKEMLKVKLPEILMLMFAGGSGDSQHTLVVYNFELVDYSVEEIKQILDGLPSNLQDKVMNTYQMLIEKGRQEEREIAARLIARERARVEQERAKAAARAERQAYAEKLSAAGKLKASGLDNEMIADIMALPLNVVESL